MEQPLGYVAQGENNICHLRKAIYELKQSLRACLRSLVLSSLAVIFIVVTQITFSLFDVLSIA